MSLYKDLMDKVHMEKETEEAVKGLYSQVRENERRIIMKKVLKPAVSIALCLSLVVLAGLGKDKLYETFTGNKAASNENSFTMLAEAAELKKGVEIVAAYGGASMSTGDEEGVSYSLSARFLCKGKNVESITYRINKGVLQICGKRMEKSDIVIAGEEAEGADLPYTGELTGVYKEFTVAYDNQPQGAVRVNMAGRKIVKDEDALFSDRLEAKKRAMNELLEGIVITCTVNYKDGTSESVDIKVKNKIMTNQEAFPEMEVAYPNRLEVHTTFELQ